MLDFTLLMMVMLSRGGVGQALALCLWQICRTPTRMRRPKRLRSIIIPAFCCECCLSIYRDLCVDQAERQRKVSFSAVRGLVHDMCQQLYAWHDVWHAQNFDMAGD